MKLRTIAKNNINIVRRIPFDITMIKSINELRHIISYKDSIAKKTMENMWQEIKK